MKDTLKTLLFDSANCRAQMIHVEKTWQHILAHHQHPKPVAHLLGQLVAASAMLSSSLKFEGSLVLQIRGDGPIQLLMAECNNTLGVRATVKLNENLPIADDADFQSLLNAQGRGLFTVILDPKNRKPGQAPYQGVVQLSGLTLTEALENYMQSSEQLKTRLYLYANDECAAGLMLQQMPNYGGNKTAGNATDTDGWERLQALSHTVTPHEMLHLSTDEMAYRLFQEENPQVLADRVVHFECTCSRQKVGRMLLRLGRPEVESALEEQGGHLCVHCDFCNTGYMFTSTQCEHLFEEEELEENLTASEEDDPARDLRTNDDQPIIH